MNNKIKYILKKEIREIFRDKKSLTMMLVTPILIPIIIIGFSSFFNMETENQTKEEASIGFTYELSREELEIANSYNIDVKIGTKKEIKELLKKEEISIYISKKDTIYQINYDENNQDIIAPLAIAENYLNSYKTFLQNNYLIRNNVKSEKVLNIIQIEHHNIGNKQENFFSNYMTSYAFLFIIMAITISATYPSTDTTAGEKERGTLETLLTFPISKKELILGKFISVALSSTITGILGYILALISLKYSEGAFEIYKGINLIPSFTTNLITIFIIICYSLLISSICITIASFSNSFKEAQSTLSPLTMITMFPGMLSLILDIKTNAFISVIPFINYMQIFTDVNKNHINILNIILMFVSTIILIIIMTYLMIRLYKQEKVLFRTEKKYH